MAHCFKILRLILCRSLNTNSWTLAEDVSQRQRALLLMVTRVPPLSCTGSPTHFPWGDAVGAG